MKNKTLTIGIVILAIVIGGVYLTSRGISDKPFATNIKDTEEAKNTQEVELKNGDTYNLTASIVKKIINSPFFDLIT